MQVKKYLIILLGIGFFYSCESIIDIELPVSEPKLVIDGQIENGRQCKISVTKSVPYFDTINFATLSSIFISDAVVILTDGTTTDTLTYTVDPASFPPLYYTSTNPLLLGTVGKRYDLTVIANGDTVTSYTTIPNPIPLDSINWREFLDFDSLGLGWLYYKDPDTLGNYYYLQAKKPSFPYYAPNRQGSVSDDRLVNGQYVLFSFAVPDAVPGWFGAATGDTTLTETSGNDRFWKKGDTIMVKFSSINYNSYLFLNTYEDAAGSFGNPFSAPTFVKGNINGGLGGFIGLGSHYSQYIIPQ